jgi:hypothetical protein
VCNKNEVLEIKMLDSHFKSICKKNTCFCKKIEGFFLLLWCHLIHIADPNRTPVESGFDYCCCYPLACVKKKQVLEIMMLDYI